MSVLIYHYNLTLASLIDDSSYTHDQLIKSEKLTCPQD